jgi:hypothetical protein
MLEEEAPRGSKGMTKGTSEGAPNEGDDADMVGMELGTTEGSTDGMILGGARRITGDREWTNLTIRQDIYFLQ